MAPPNASSKRSATKTSEIWKHYRDLQGGVVECNACKHRITRHVRNVASSVLMWLHLRSKHKDIFAATEYYKRRQAAYASQAASATSQALNGEGRSPFYREGSRFDALTTLKLEKFYKQQPCPTIEARKRLAARWKVPVASISGWFMKRRQKERLFSKMTLSNSSKTVNDDDDAPAWQEIGTHDFEHLIVHTVDELLSNAAQSVTGPEQSEATENIIAEADDAAPPSESGEDNEPDAAASNLGKATDANRPGILKRISASGNAASPAASGFATPQSEVRKKVKFWDVKQRVTAVGRSEPAPAAATPSAALSGPINASARPSLPYVPRVAQTTLVGASADEDIVEASGRAVILRLQKIREKSHASFLRALQDIDNVVFKHEMSIV
ncbi:hypothetical protein AAVH_22396 [Aphelenchoides avenae]|nr:hypothetical protein AAVH_22396 [Aphelenchus avenae]